MKISRECAIQILKYCDKHKRFYFPFFVMCKEYSPEDDDFVEIEHTEWPIIQEDDTYQTFELWEKLLQTDTDLVLNRLSLLIKNYKKYLIRQISQKDDLEASDLYEFLSGKLDAYEECKNIVLETIKLNYKGRPRNIL